MSLSVLTRRLRAKSLRGAAPLTVAVALPAALAYYPFEDTPNDWYGSAPLNSGSIGYSSGKFGEGATAASCKASTQPLNGRSTSDPFSIACWVLMTGNGGAYTQITLGNTVSGAHYGAVLTVSAAGSLSLGLDSGNGSITDNSSSFSSDFHHFAATMDGGVVRLYVDGAEVTNGSGLGGATVFSNISDSNAIFVLINSTTLDELALFDVALTPAEVAQLASGGSQFQTNPTTPTDLGIGSRTDTSISLTWIDGTGGNTTQVFISTDGGSTYVDSGFSGSGAATVTGLSPAVHPYFQVRNTKNGALFSTFSVPTDAYTRPQAPINVVASVPTDTDMRVDYDAFTVTTGIVRVDVTMGTDGSSYPTAVAPQSSGFGSPTTIASVAASVGSPLTPDTLYYFRGVSFTAADADQSLPTDSTPVRTLLNPPTTFAVDSFTDTSVTVSWTPGTVSGDSYTIERSAPGANVWSTYGVTGSSPVTLVATLGDNYDLRVKATKSSNSNVSAWSGTITFQTAYPATSFASVYDDVSAVGLTWTDPAGRTDWTGWVLTRTDDSVVIASGSTGASGGIAADLTPLAGQTNHYLLRFSYSGNGTADVTTTASVP